MHHNTYPFAPITQNCNIIWKYCIISVCLPENYFILCPGIRPKLIIWSSIESEPGPPGLNDGLNTWHYQGHVLFWFSVRLNNKSMRQCICTRFIYNDVKAIEVILFILVVLLLTLLLFIIWGWGSKLFYFWLDCHLQYFDFFDGTPFKKMLRHPNWCCFYIFHLVGLK